MEYGTVILRPDGSVSGYLELVKNKDREQWPHLALSPQSDRYSILSRKARKWLVS